jgi:hypothetical protein
MLRQGFWTVEIEDLDQDLVENWDLRVLRLLRLGFLSCRDFFDMLRQSFWKCWNFLTTLRLGFFSCQDWDSLLRPCWKLRLKGIETRRDKVSESAEVFSTCQSKVFELSRSRVSIKTLLKIKTLGYGDRRDLDFLVVETFSTCWDKVFEVLRFSHHVETWLF